jgi:O-methyltransferase
MSENTTQPFIVGANTSRTGRDMYLDLMKRCLLNDIYGDEEYDLVVPRQKIKRWISGFLAHNGIELVRRRKVDASLREEGKHFPRLGHTMVGRKRLDNIQFCLEEVLAHDVPGDCIETGVWQGGSTIFMRAILKAHNVLDRKVWVADSFDGLPPPNSKQYPADEGDMLYATDILRVTLDKVRQNFAAYGLLDGQVRFLKGWFKDTLPTAPIERLAVIRLDGDMYESTLDALSNLYPKLSIGGFLIVDDYGGIPACRQAVEDYRRKHSIVESIEAIDWTGVYWRKQK